MGKIVDKKNQEQDEEYGVARVFKYNIKTDAIVDGNTVQMAFLRRQPKKAPKTLLDLTWNTKENGKIIKRGINVSGHGKYGVPTLVEYDTYIALQRIFINKKTRNGICELLPLNERTSDDYLTIEFSINELAKEMGYKSPNSSTREILKRSIDILVATTIFSTENGGIYDISKKRYINNSMAVHFVESVVSTDYDDENGENINYTKLKISRFTYEQILHNYKLFYDKTIYNRTKNKLAKKIYHMALQWKGKNKISYANINTIIERIPMLDEKEKYKKRAIKEALEELNKKDMIKIEYDPNNNDKVYFLFDNDIKYSEIKEELKIKYNTYDEIINKLKDLNLNEKEIDSYFNVENIRYVQALLRYMDSKTTIKNPKAYYKRCYTMGLKNQLRIPDKFYNTIC